MVHHDHDDDDHDLIGRALNSKRRPALVKTNG